MRAGLYLQNDYPLREAIKLAQYAEMRGFDAVWQADTQFHRDAVVMMAALAANTSRIKIGSAVLNVWTRNAVTLASTFATLDDLAPDRMICGLGPWWEPVAGMLGVNRRKPLLAVREMVTVVRRLLAGERVDYSGEFVQLRDVVLGLERPVVRKIPLYIGATSAKMAALAGEIADGVLLNFMVSPQHNHEVMAEVERGLRLSGRSMNVVDRPQLVVCSVHTDRATALDQARRVVTRYLADQPRMMARNGVPHDLLAEIAQVLPPNGSELQVSDAMRLVPDDVVQLVTASGTPDEVRAKARAYVDAGATMPVIYALGDDPRMAIDVFSDHVS